MSIGDLHQTCTWVWVCCEHLLPPNHYACGHCSPLALAPLVIRWGPDASTDMLRGCARCTKCGGKGAAIKTPSWGGMQSEHGPPFPVEQMIDQFALAPGKAC